MHVIATNVASGMLPADGRIEISFDRLLLPFSIHRQSFVLTQMGGTMGLTPHVAYDPVARVVTITPTDCLTNGQPYTVRIASPASAADLNGLRTIDGATLASDSLSEFTFTASAPSNPGTCTPPAVGPGYIDYCASIQSILISCTSCHVAPTDPTLPTSAAGLALDTPAGIQQTALARASIEANTGPLSGAGGNTSLSFGQDMPIVDVGGGPSGSGVDPHTMPVQYPGDPAHSLLLYKTLMALPAANAAGSSPYTYTVACDDAGSTCPQPLPDDERARLSDMVLGREMPYPGDPRNGINPAGLSLVQMETLNAWISEGAPLPQGDAGCP